jgi:hypothetical protein
MRLKALFFSMLVCGGFSAFAEQKQDDQKAETKSEKPWMEVQNVISILRTRSGQLDKNLKELIEERKKATAPERISELQKEIDKTYQQLKETNADLRKQEQIYRYRFPERAAKEGERSYQTQETPSLERIEEQVGVEGKMQRNLRRMRGQYGTAEQKRKDLNSPEKAPSPTPQKGEKNIREEDSPVLRK